MDRKAAITQLLRDSEVFPSNDVLAQALADSYTAYTDFTRKLPYFSIDLEWRYYNDGKAWLGKGVGKKKTIFWLSIWGGFFVVTFLFTEKTRVGIQELDASCAIKTLIANEPVTSRLIPLKISVYSHNQLEDVYSLISYKQGLK